MLMKTQHFVHLSDNPLWCWSTQSGLTHRWVHTKTLLFLTFFAGFYPWKVLKLSRGVATHPPVPHATNGTLQAVFGHAAGQKLHGCGQRHHHHQISAAAVVAAVTGDTGGRNMLLLLPLLPPHVCLTLIGCLSCSCAWTWHFWHVACSRMGQRTQSLACGTGGCIATSTGSFSYSHHGKAFEKGGKQPFLV